MFVNSWMAGVANVSAAVCDEDVAAPIHGDPRQGRELPVAAAEATPFRKEGALVVELLDSVVTGVGDEDVPTSIDGDAVGKLELPVAQLPQASPTS